MNKNNAKQTSKRFICVKKGKNVPYKENYYYFCIEIRRIIKVY